MPCTIQSNTHAATVAQVLSQDEWMDHQDVKDALGWGPDASASSVLSDMYSNETRGAGCLERRSTPQDSFGDSEFEYRLTDDIIID